MHNNTNDTDLLLLYQVSDKHLNNNNKTIILQSGCRFWQKLLSSLLTLLLLFLLIVSVWLMSNKFFNTTHYFFYSNFSSHSDSNGSAETAEFSSSSSSLHSTQFFQPSLLVREIDNNSYKRRRSSNNNNNYASPLASFLFFTPLLLLPHHISNNNSKVYTNTLQNVAVIDDSDDRNSVSKLSIGKHLLGGNYYRRRFHEDVQGQTTTTTEASTHTKAMMMMMTPNAALVNDAASPHTSAHVPYEKGRKKEEKETATFSNNSRRSVHFDETLVSQAKEDAEDEDADQNTTTNSLLSSVYYNVTTTQLYKQKKQERIRRLPQALIIGVRKGGTRAVVEFLSAHPRVRAASKEMHYFNRNENYAKGLEWYRSKMPLTLDDELTIEKTPAYFVTASAPERVLAMDPNTKLVIVVREPVNRTISDYVQWAVTKQARNRTYPPIEQLVIGADGLVNVSYTPVGFSLYDLHIQRWLQRFPRSQMHLIDGDRFVHEPHAELYELENFLGLSHFLTPEMFYFNATKGFYCIKQPETEQQQDALYERMRSSTTSNRFKSCLGETKGRRHPQVDERVLQQLQTFYRPHNEKFFNVTGRRFENW